MGNIVISILEYLLKVITSTFCQILILLGPLIILAFLINIIAGLNEKQSYRVFGVKSYLIFFGWLGTAIHEIGHAFFALIFGHRIIEMKLFTPNSGTGTLGYVNHSYNPDSIYQNIGNFFIGIGPIIFGSMTLFIISYFLFGYNFNIMNKIDITLNSFAGLSSFKMVLQGIFTGLKDYSFFVFSGPKSAWWKIVLLIYVLYSVGSSITLSLADIEGALSGFLFFFGILLFFNLSTLWIGNFTFGLFIKASSFFSVEKTVKLTT